jgi:hypothetical protein
MRNAMAVTGYVNDKTSADLTRLKALGGSIDVSPERSVRDVVIRVSWSDVDETRVGATEAGMTLIQLILRDGATVETIIRSEASPAGLRAFSDPVLNRVVQEATAKSITV